MNRFIFLFIVALVFFRQPAFSYEYHIQEKSLDPTEQRIMFSITKEMQADQFLTVNRNSNELLNGLSVHQLFISLLERKTLALVFLDNKNQIKYPDKLDLGTETVYHFPFKKTVLAIWVQNFTNDEQKKIMKMVATQVLAENESVWNQIIPHAYAESCEIEPPHKTALNSLIGKLNENNYSFCWDKLSEGASSYTTEIAHDIKQTITLDFDLRSYWNTIKNVAGGVANFASDFLRNPISWVQKNVPNSISLDLSGLANIDKHQMLGLACLALGHEGLPALVSSMARGPAGIGLKLFQMLNKFSAVTKIISLLKKFGSLSSKKMALMKDKIIKLAEKMIKGEHSQDKVESISGLMRVSPELAKEGLTCLGI